MINFAGNNLFLAKDVKISARNLRRINSRISKAKRLMGITTTCNVPFVVAYKEGSLAAYNPRTDAIFVDPRLGSQKMQELRELQQEYVCPDHPLSTLVHEMFHWLDAYEYRRKGGKINDTQALAVYTVYQREATFQYLKSAGFDLESIYIKQKSISANMRPKCIMKTISRKCLPNTGQNNC